MALTHASAYARLRHLFQNEALALVGDASGLQPSAAPGNLYLSLHTASPGVAGNQTTNESAYGSYTRIPLVRSAVGWTVDLTGFVENAAAIVFPTCSSGTETVTHIGVGTDLAGAGLLLMFEELDAPQEVRTGVGPDFPIGTLVITES